jgi:hypothetical protein
MIDAAAATAAFILGWKLDNNMPPGKAPIFADAHTTGHTAPIARYTRSGR